MRSADDRSLPGRVHGLEDQLRIVLIRIERDGYDIQALYAVPNRVGIFQCLDPLGKELVVLHKLRRLFDDGYIRID